MLRRVHARRNAARVNTSVVVITIVLGISQGQVAASSAANLVAAYAYDDGSGTTAADASISSNTATVTATSWSAACKFGRCLAFSGANSFVESPDLDVLTPGTKATFEAWVRLTAAPAETASVFNKWNQTANDEYLFGISPSRTLYFAWHTTGGNTWPSAAFNAVNSSGTIPLNSLTHIAVVRNGTVVRFYINGALDSSSAVMDNNPFRNGANSLRIGGQGRGTKGRFLTGTIDEVRIYHRALSQADIQHDMQTPIAAALDIVPPIVMLTAPAPGATVAGTTTVSATATDLLGGVAGVRFYVDGAPLGAEDTTSPYAVNWNSTTAANGSHTITAVARDTAGLQSSTLPTMVTVANDETPPAVSISTPVANATLADTVSVVADATDNGTVAGVQFRLNGAPLGAEDVTSPFTVTWNTTTAANGSHTLTAVARDAAGNTSTSAAVTVTVSNNAPSLPDAVAAYSYNDGAGTTAADQSVHNNTANVSGAGWSSACKFGNCLQFNGTSSFVESADIAPLTPATEVTFQAWVSLSATPAETASIFNKWNQTANDEYIVGITAARAVVFAWHTTGSGSWPSPSFNEATSTSTIPLNTLTHIAVVRNGTTLTFYVNGTPDPSLTVLDTNPFRNGSNTLRVGGQGRGGRNRFFPGVIDEPRIYTRALTQAEIQAGMNTPIGADTTPPVLSAVTAVSVTSSSATIAWTTNESSDTQLEWGTTAAYGNMTPLDGSPVTDHAVTLGALSPSRLYHYRVRSRDVAGNLAVSGDHTFTTSNVDSVPPTVSLTAPGANSTISGTVTVSANAADNAGVAGVQFKLDGEDLGFMDTAAPYAITWDTTATLNGAHTLTAVARDAAGNSTSSTAAVVTVSNAIVMLEWDANTEANLAGYKVYVGDASGVYTISFDVGNTTTYTVRGLQAGRLYYFAVKAYDQSMNESDFSNEVSTTTP
jgi:hypothetical protein